MTLPEIITAYLEQTGASRGALAVACGVHRNTVGNWLRGLTDPPDAELARLLDAVSAPPSLRRQVWAARLEVEPSQVARVVGSALFRAQGLDAPVEAE